MACPRPVVMGSNSLCGHDVHSALLSLIHNGSRRYTSDLGTGTVSPIFTIKKGSRSRRSELAPNYIFSFRVHGPKDRAITHYEGLSFFTTGNKHKLRTCDSYVSMRHMVSNDKMAQCQEDESQVRQHTGQQTVGIPYESRKGFAGAYEDSYKSS